MLAIHLFLLAIEEHYMVEGDKNQIFCDNLGAIYTFQQRSQRVTSGAKNVDIQRVLRRIQNRMTSPLTSKHVRAHQDDSKKRSTLLIEAQRNCRCDDLAKAAIYEAMMDVPGPAQGYVLPLEDACVFINNGTQTADVTKDLRFHIGSSVALR